MLSITGSPSTLIGILLVALPIITIIRDIDSIDTIDIFVPEWLLNFI